MYEDKYGKHAAINGNKSAIEQFSKTLGYRLSEATVHNF